MALVVYNRVQETTATTGTGTITLAGAVSGFQSFAVVGNGNTTYYTITSGTAWEVGIGTYTSAGTTLARTTVLSNSLGTTAAISLTGTSNVWVDYPSEKSIYYDGTALGMARLTGFATTATAAGTTTLTSDSSFYQIFTGSTTQTITLPVVTTLITGWTFHIVNNSTGNLTVNSSGANLVSTIPPGTTLMATCILVTGTTAASWEYGLTDFSTYTGTGSVVLSASPTFTGTPTAPQFSASNGMYINNKTIGTTYSIPAGSSAMSAGPVTISSGVVITVPSGSRWVVL